METVRIRKPDDWHLHLRDGAEMAAVIPHTVRCFGRAIIMPNLQPPITTSAQAIAYRNRILARLPKKSTFQPLMTLYLRDTTEPQEIQRAKESDCIYCVKLYPAGATTNAEQGVQHLRQLYPVLACMEREDFPLLIHGEATDPNIDVFDREARFIESTLIPLTRDFPELRLILEHITTAEAVDFITESSERIAATITPHHLLYNRSALFAGGIRPHYFCLPVLKRESHRQALIQAATRGNPKFFLGTDSAPHARGAKESACGCAGIFNAHAAIELYAEVFSDEHALDKLEGFASVYGAQFYGLPLNEEFIQLRREPWIVPETYAFGARQLRPLRAGESVAWRIV